jgi:hypothetical protein
LKHFPRPGNRVSGRLAFEASGDMGKWAQAGYERTCADKMKTLLLV